MKKLIKTAGQTAMVNVNAEKQVINKVQDCQILIDGEWGVNYDPETKTMLGGYSIDGKTFKTEFIITEIDEERIYLAIHICSDLYSSYGTIASPYEALVKEYDKGRI